MSCECLMSRVNCCLTFLKPFLFHRDPGSVWLAQYLPSRKFKMNIMLTGNLVVLSQNVENDHTYTYKIDQKEITTNSVHIHTHTHAHTHTCTHLALGEAVLALTLAVPGAPTHLLPRKTMLPGCPSTLRGCPSVDSSRVCRLQ
jgi:hypothetical protein